jgi:hypothetical protein
MRKKIISGVLALFIFSLSFVANPAAASGSSLSLSATGDGDSVQVNVSGAANSSVLLSYYNNYVPQVAFLGNTNGSGYFSTNISTAAYGISANSLVHVMVGGVSGSQSSDVAWPYIASSNLALDKTSLVLPIGQSATITAYNNGTNLIYLANNSNPVVANANLNGSQITVTAINYGSTVINICSQSNTASCASAYINVQNTGSNPLAFGFSNIGLTNGQTSAVNIYGGTGSYLLSNNTNSNAVTASISNGVVNLKANAASGSAAISICSSDLSSCGIINANIGASNPAVLAFSQPAPTLSIGQSLTVDISGGGNSSYSVFSNNHSNIISTNLANSSLTLNALTGGSATVIVCSSLGNCGSLSATVMGANGSGGLIALSQNNVWLSANQNLSLTVSGGVAPYNILPDSSNTASASVSGNIITVTGIKSGSATIGVCSAGGGCTNLSVLVNGASVNTNTSLTLSPSQTALSSLNSSATVNIFGNGSYFISSNSNPNVATAIISASQVIITSVGAGSDTFSVCQNGGQCANLSVSVTVAAPAVSTPIVSAPAAVNTPSASVANNSLARTPDGKIYFISNNARVYVTSLKDLQVKYAGKKIADVTFDAVSQIPVKTSVYKFSNSLVYGARGQEVLELQKRLKALNLYSGPLDSHYTAAVVAAVRKYQKNNNIKQTGNVGPVTAASLNK